MRPLLAAHIRPSALSLPSLAKWWDARFVDGSNNALDRSGNAKTGTNANATIQTNIDRGRPIFRFNGTTARLTFSSLITGTSFSAFVRMKTTNSTTAAGLILWINGAADHQVLCGAAGPVISCYAGASNYPKSNTIDNYTNFSTIGVVCTSGTCVFYQDGASIGTGAQTISSRTLTNFGGSTSFFSAFDLTACLLATAAFNANQIALATHILTNQ